MATVASGRLTVGKTYLFKNKADGSRALNVWCSSSYPATSLSNICLWTADTSGNAQLWKLVDYNGHYVLQSVENTSMYLDLYTGSGNGANRNAHLYSVSSTSYLTFEAGAYSNTVRIRLAGSTNNGHYLTANQGVTEVEQERQPVQREMFTFGAPFFRTTVRNGFLMKLVALPA